MRTINIKIKEDINKMSKNTKEQEKITQTGVKRVFYFIVIVMILIFVMSTISPLLGS